MADREKLQEVDVTSASGYQTKVRTRHPERYRARERDAKAKAREPAAHRARQPTTAKGDVETK